MFDIGSRVIVLSSSFSSGTGPKRGSLGYVDDLFSIAAEETFFDEDNELFARHHKIYFTRYGFEKSGRLESHFFISVIPSIDGHQAKKILDGLSVEEVVEKKIEEMTKINPDTLNFFSGMRHMVAGKYGVKNVHVGMLSLATPSCDLMSCSPNDLRAWLDCVVTNEKLLATVQEMLHNPAKLDKTIPYDDIERVLTLKSDRGFRSQVLADSIINAKTREWLITTIRKVVAVARRPEISKVRKNDIQWLRHGPFNTHAREANGIRLILNNFGTTAGPIYFQEALKANEGNQIFLIKAQFLKALSQRIVSLARSLEREAEEVQTQTVNG
jgi:hypothetical protein